MSQRLKTPLNQFCQLSNLYRNTMNCCKKGFAVISLSFLSAGFISCSDHVAEAQVILKDSKVIQEESKLDSIFLNDFSLTTTLKFSSETIGSKLDEIELILSPDKQNNLSSDVVAEFWHYEGNSKELVKEETMSRKDDQFLLNIQHDVGLSDTTLIDYIDVITLRLTSSQELHYHTEIPRNLMIQNQQIFQQGSSQFTDNEASILNSTLQTLKSSNTHLKLALKGNHQKHFVHTAQFLFGRKGRNPQWAIDAPINNVDTTSIITRLNYIQTYLIDQGQWGDDAEEVKILKLHQSLSEFQEGLSNQMDQLEDWFHVDDSEAAIHAQDLIDLLDSNTPLIESLITEINPLMVNTKRENP